MPLQTLAGVRVLDFSSYLAGPYSSTLLADMGADVIKVETPEGDMIRHYPSTLEGESRYHLGVNRNKRGMVLDLKREGARRVCHELLRSADVVTHNFRPGVADKLGLDFASVQAIRSDVVYCSLTGYGLTGPSAAKPGFDQVLQCLSGIAAAQGNGGTPTVQLGSVIDYYSASMAAMAISAALFRRASTGQAQFIEASLLRSALTMQAGRLIWADGEPSNIERDLKAGRLAGIHPAKDSFIYLQAQTPAFWRSLCELTGLAHLADDPRYDDMRKRKERENELLPLLREALSTKTALEWEALFGDRVPCAAVRSVEEMFDNPQVQSQELVVHHTHPRVGAYRTIVGPVAIRSADEQATPERRAPLLGEHTVEILTEAGFSTTEIDGLRAQGAIN
jgi:formyl-CoA transferase